MFNSYQSLLNILHQRFQPIDTAIRIVEATIDIFEADVEISETAVDMSVRIGQPAADFLDTLVINPCRYSYSHHQRQGDLKNRL